MPTSLNKDKIKDEVFLESLKKRNFRTKDGQLSRQQQTIVQRLWDNADVVASKAMAIINPK